VHDDRVGAVFGKTTQQSVIPTRIGEWPVSDGMVQGDEKQRLIWIFEQPPQAQGPSGLDHVQPLLQQSG
jgi:hypothetical protein